MNVFNPLLKELFEISGQNVNRTPQPKPQRKAPQKKVKTQPQAVSQKNEPVKEAPKVTKVTPVPQERTVAGIPLNAQTVRQGIIMSEILGRPLCKRR